MLTKHTRIAGAAAAVIAAGLAGYSLRPSSNSAKLVAARNPAAEVRTEVIRRTIHIVKHQRTGQGGGHGRVLVASAGGVRTAGGGRAVSTGASHHSAAVVGSGTAAAPVTRTSVHSAPSGATGAPASSGHPVTTRTSKHSSGSSSGSGSHSSGTPVTTRTSSHSSGSGSSGKPVTTRSSSGGGGDGGDGSQKNDN